MPEISRFLGITVYMLFDDHLPPHFHAEYGGQRISVSIVEGAVEGRFPRRALGALLEWQQMHRDELMADWQRAERHEVLQRIEPLE